MGESTNQQESEPSAASVAADALPTQIATKLAAALAEHLRVEVTASALPWEAMRYDEFQLSLASTTCLAVLRVDPGAAQILLDLPLPLIYPMIDRVLGGTGQTPVSVPQRPLSAIEHGLAMQIVERAAGLLADTLSAGSPATVREETIESTPADVRIMPADEVVTVMRFDVSLSGAAGVVSLCLPEPVMQQLRIASAQANGFVEVDEMSGLTKNILNAAVELRALLAETNLWLSDVLTMQIGDVITTEHPADGDIAIDVNGEVKMYGKLGHMRGVRSVQISRLPVDDDSHGGQEARQ